MLKRKRKKKTRYHTGTHKSAKCKTPIEFRSQWEQVICLFLDKDQDVIEYSYETISIPYISNLKTKKIRNYYPDFLVIYKDGTKKMIEVKREDKLSDSKVLKKAAAAKRWCEEQNPKVQYEFWTNKIILPLKKIYELDGSLPKKRKVKRKTRKTVKRKR